jgi:ParB-like chromosome segregation protein Spo0J
MGNLGLIGNAIMSQAKAVFEKIDSLSDEEKIETINQIKICLHDHSPFKMEPVDCVLWVEGDLVQANDYNPNVVAPPEMKLLRHSIETDGYTQPIVSFAEDNHYEVVDGFHRNRVGKEYPEVRKRIKGYLPISVINPDRTEREDRIAATIRHNRARGKHQVQGMSEIVLELSRRNWSDQRIAKELGMDADEVLRMKQITGLAELFADKEFSEAWEVDLEAEKNS